MAEERFDIEVVDKVDKSVETKLRGIAKEAREGYTAVEKLKAALASINASPVQKLADATAKVTNNLQQQLAAQGKLTAATNTAAAADTRAEAAKARLAAETAKAALAEQRLATEAAKTQGALSKAAAAQSQAATAALRHETATRRAAAATSDTSREAGRLEASVDRLKASVDPLGFAFDRLNAELLEAQRLYALGAINATEFAQAERVLTQRINENVAAQRASNGVMIGSAKNMRQAQLAGVNLSRQFADIGVTAAMGMNPLLILIQQGPQIADVMAEMKMNGVGMGAAFRSMGAFLAPLLPMLLIVAAVIGTIAAGFGLLHRELSKGYPKDITDGLGLTAEQLDRVKSRTVTFGDTVMATFTVIGRHIMAGPIGDALRWLGDRFSETLDFMVQFTVKSVAKIIAFFVASYETITKHWRNFPQVISVIMAKAVNLFIGGVEDLTNQTIVALNHVIAAANRLPGIEIPEIDPVSIKRVTTASDAVTSSIQADFENSFAAAEAAARKGMSNIAKEIQDEALARARRRALEEAGDPNKGAKGRKGKEEWDRAAELQNVNRELDNELKRMGMLKDAREVQQRLDQISQKFAERKVPLDAAETEAIRNKIVAIQDAARVQQEMDRIYQEANGPLDRYTASLKAADELLKRSAISQEQFNAAVNKAKFEYQNAVDPLLQHTKALQDEIALYGLYGAELERAQYMQQINNELLAQGKSLYDASTGALTAEAQALLNKYNALQMIKQAQPPEATGLGKQFQDLIAYRDGMANAFAQIDAWKSQDVANTERYEKMKHDIQQHYNDLRLGMASSMFGELAKLSSSGNKKLAAIGKAAAVAQATIDGYLAVQKALASAPPPINYVNAGIAAIKAAANVAGILSTNVGGFATGGQFTVAGRDGRDANLINMGVTKGERVTVETAAQARANDNAAGRAAPQDVSFNAKIVNIVDKDAVIEGLDSGDYDQVIINAIGRNPNQVAGLIRN